MPRMSTFVLLCAALIAVTAPLAYADCSTGDQHLMTDGAAIFGLRWDGTVIGEGQSFVLDCDARFETAAFRFEVTEGGSISGQPYLLATDIMIFELMDMDFNVLATTSAPLGFADGAQWLVFDVTDQNIQLTAGDYIVGCRTEAPRLALVSYDPDNLHAGTRYSFWIDAWGGGGTSSDIAFQATWEPTLVPSDRSSWGALKTSYR